MRTYLSTGLPSSQQRAAMACAEDITKHARVLQLAVLSGS